MRCPWPSDEFFGESSIAAFWSSQAEDEHRWTPASTPIFLGTFASEALTLFLAAQVALVDFEGICRVPSCLELRTLNLERLVAFSDLPQTACLFVGTI